ncbi:MAG: cell envelope integrity protein TolA [Gammaproteobacteria bacterium]|nr:cell envelope integrity protein TolA [Gammaproteobacteria bacterium]
MRKFFSQYSGFLILSIAFHVVVVSALLIGFDSKPAEIKKYGVKKQNIIQAVSVNEKLVKNELNKILAAEKRKKRKEVARQKRLNDEAKKAKANRIKEQKKLASLKKKQKETKKKLKQQKLAEQKKIQVLRKKQKQEKLKLKKLANAAAVLKKKKESERKKLEALQAKKRAEKKKAEQAKRQQELRKLMEAEEREQLTRQLRGVTLSYIASIQAVVKANWRRPAKLTKDAKCKVNVKQIPGGEIIYRQVSNCTGGNGFKRSVETALAKTSHLPAPPDPRVFDREIVFTFKEK